MEVYTRAISNYWVAGRRTFYRANAKAVDIAYDNVNDHQEPPAEDEDEEFRRNKQSIDEDYVEAFLVAAKKDTSLAEVESNSLSMKTFPIFCLYSQIAHTHTQMLYGNWRCL